MLLTKSNAVAWRIACFCTRTFTMCTNFISGKNVSTCTNVPRYASPSRITSANILCVRKKKFGNNDELCVNIFVKLSNGNYFLGKVNFPLNLVRYFEGKAQPHDKLFLYMYAYMYKFCLRETFSTRGSCVHRYTPSRKLQNICTRWGNQTRDQKKFLRLRSIFRWKVNDIRIWIYLRNSILFPRAKIYFFLLFFLQMRGNEKFSTLCSLLMWCVISAA
jgi:hypothetical protein